MAIEIRQITTRCGLRKFVEFGNDLYKDCENFCPHLVMDEMNTFDTKRILHMRYATMYSIWRIWMASRWDG